MLAEVGGLGFIGLFLSVVVTGGPLGNLIGDISEEFLGDEELVGPRDRFHFATGLALTLLHLSCIFPAP